VRIGIPELLRQPKIDNVHQVCLFADTCDDIARFKVAVNEVARVDILEVTELNRSNVWQLITLEAKFTHQLARQEKDSSQSELTTVLNEEFCKGGAKAFGHHRIEASFCTKPMSTRDTDTSLQLRVDLKLVV
jgi:hypothetical protein